MSFYQTKEWKEIRQKVLKETPNCAICSSKEAIDVHHKRHFKESKDNTRSNLIVLCRPHHQKIHTLEGFYHRQHSPRSFDRIFKEVLTKYQNPQKTEKIKRASGEGESRKPCVSVMGELQDRNIQSSGVADHLPNPSSVGIQETADGYVESQNATRPSGARSSPESFSLLNEVSKQ